MKTLQFNKFQKISLHDDLQKQDRLNFNINPGFHPTTWVNKIILITLILISILCLYFFMFTPSVSKQNKGELEKHISSEIFQILKRNVYYDIHYFIDDQHSSQSQKLVANPPLIQAKTIQQRRQLIQITQSEQEMERTLHQMMVPSFFTRFIASFYKLCKKEENLPKMYFANSLSKNPQKKQYLQAEFYKFNKDYDIGSYGDQLPFCILVSGRNDVDVVEKMYQSIRKQNYSNYFVIHVDDASTDGTPQKVLQYLERNPDMAKKVKMVTQPYRKNAIYNRDLGIRKYCREDDIVIDADADDWLIGRQVFQLVNTLYQKQHIYKGQKQQIWAIYFNNIANTRHFGLPVAFYEQDITEEELQRSMYRIIVNWRTTLLRTYRKKLYMKVDINDFIDKVATKPGQFFVEQYDAFMHFPMVEMSGFKHMKIIDEFVYFYNVNLYNDKNQSQNYYSSLGSQTLPPYNPLQSLDDEPKRNYEFKHPKQYITNFEMRKKQVEEKRKRLKQTLEKELVKTGYKFNTSYS